MIAIRSATVLTIFRGRRYVFFSCILPSPYLFFCFPPARFGHRPRSQEAPPLKLARKRPVQAGHQKPTLRCGSVAAGFHHRRSPQKVSVFTSRRSHAMGVFTSSSPICYRRRHQFINIFQTRGRVLSERIQSTIRVVPQLRLWSRRVW